MSTYTRAIDELGRIVIPAEARKHLGVLPKQALTLTILNDKIVLENPKPSCKLCGSTDEIDKKFCICSSCLNKIKNAE